MNKTHIKLHPFQKKKERTHCDDNLIRHLDVRKLQLKSLFSKLASVQSFFIIVTVIYIYIYVLTYVCLYIYMYVFINMYIYT